MPGIREQISNDVLSGKYLYGKHEGLTSIVICLEDSIADEQVEKAELNVVIQLQAIYQGIQSGLLSSEDVPLLFIRVRFPDQIQSIVNQLGKACEILCGFVFPKFSPDNAEHYLEALKEVNITSSYRFYGMPILESAEIIYKENRVETLVQLKASLDNYFEYILNVRIGATDFSGLFGIRRDSDTTIYDIAVIRDCISDIINLFGRSDKEYVISGPVWEYFSGSTRILKPQIRQTPFQQAFGRNGLLLRSKIISRFEDSLIHEVLLDKTNGLVGKTIIHPSHILPVQSMNVVSFEEYMDASMIIKSAESFNGVIKSEFANKMNEIKPHYNWARKTIIKSNVYGVFHEQQSFIDLLNTKNEEQLYV
jgi:citrate lyase beta subunit